MKRTKKKRKRRILPITILTFALVFMSKIFVPVHDAAHAPLDTTHWKPHQHNSNCEHLLLTSVSSGDTIENHRRVPHKQSDNLLKLANIKDAANPSASSDNHRPLRKPHSPPSTASDFVNAANVLEIIRPTTATINSKHETSRKQKSLTNNSLDLVQYKQAHRHNKQIDLVTKHDSSTYAPVTDGAKRLKS
ncbi:hypothetical protein GZH46_00144, partial [Fragariocoptes setiger]